MANVNDVFVERFEGHRAYLSPEWAFSTVTEEDESETTASEPRHDVLSLVTNEISSYIGSHVQFRHEAMQSTATKAEDGIAWVSLDAVQNATIQEHSGVNFRYCKQLLRYLISTHVDPDANANTQKGDGEVEGGYNASDRSAPTLALEDIPAVFSEYIEYAPGPWREAAFVDVLINDLIPRLLRRQQQQLPAYASAMSAMSAKQDQERRNAQASDPLFGSSDANNAKGVESDAGWGTTREGSAAEGYQSAQDGSHYPSSGNEFVAGTALEGEESSPSVSASGSQSQSFTDGLDGWDDFADTASLLSSGTIYRPEHQKLVYKLKKAAHTVNRLKAEVAMCKEALDNVKHSDLTLLQDKLRGAQTDLNTVRRRNTELKDRVQSLEASLFEALSSGGGGVSGSALNQARQNRAKTARQNNSQDFFGYRDDGDDASDTSTNADVSRAVFNLNVAVSAEEPTDAPSDATQQQQLGGGGSGAIDALTRRTKQIVNQAKRHAAALSVSSVSVKSGSGPVIDSAVRGSETDMLHAQTHLQETVSRLRAQVSEYETRISSLQSALDARVPKSAAVHLPGQERAQETATDLVPDPVTASQYQQGSKHTTAATDLQSASLSQLLRALPTVVSADHKKLIERAANEQLRASKDVDRRTIDALLQENDRISAMLSSVQHSASGSFSDSSREGLAAADPFRSAGVAVDSNSANASTASIDASSNLAYDTGLGKGGSMLPGNSGPARTSRNGAAVVNAKVKTAQSFSSSLGVSPRMTMFLSGVVGFIIAWILPWLNSVRHASPS